MLKLWKNSLCITQWAEHLKKGQAYTPDANHEAFSPLNLQGCELSQAKQGLPRDTEGTCRGTPKYITTSEGSDPHPQQDPEGLHHHILVQGPLGRVQTFPLLRSEIYEHILEG